MSHLQAKLLVAVIMLSTFLESRAQTFSWVKNFDLTPAKPSVCSIVTDKNSNVILAATYEPPNQFSETAISKYSPAGQLQWSNFIKTSYGIRQALVEDTGELLVIAGSWDGYSVYRYSPSGVLLKKTLLVPTVNGSDINSIYSVAVDKADASSYYISGIFMQTMQLGSVTLYNTDKKPLLFIAKYSMSDSCLWARSSDSGNCGPLGTLTAFGGKLYASGEFYDTFSIQGKNITASGSNGLVVAFDGTGNVQWLYNFGDAGSGYSPEFINSVSVDESGVYLTGSYANDLNCCNISLTTNAPYSNIVLTKLGFDGACNWTKQIGGLDHDFPVAVRTNARSTDIYVTGNFAGKIELDGQFLSSARSFSNNGVRDLFLASFNKSTGKVTAAIKAGADSSSFIYDNSLSISPEGVIYLSGISSGLIEYGGINKGSKNPVFYCANIAHTNWTQLTAVNDIPVLFEIKPNPNDGVFTVTISSEIAAGSNFKIYNLLGETVYSQYLYSASNDLQIELDNVPKGVYFASICGNSISSVKKIIIN